MQVLRIGLAAALAVGLSGVSAMAQDSGEPASVSFDLRTSARVVSRAVGQGPDTLAAFVGEGSADATRRSVDVSLDQLSQREGEGTLDVTPSGPMKRLRRSRVFVGRGTASATIGDEQTDFEKVRFAARVRGGGERVRLLGKFNGREAGDVAAESDSDVAVPLTVLNGRFRGQLAPAESAD